MTKRTIVLLLAMCVSLPAACFAFSYCLSSCAVQDVGLLSSETIYCDSNEHCVETMVWRGVTLEAECQTGDCETEAYCSPAGECVTGDRDMDGHLFPDDCDDSNPHVYPGQTELCNNVDDDCDGVTDSFTRQCGDTNTGICQIGYETCYDGVWVGCNAVFPSAEVCDDDVDNDCDGLKDIKDLQCFEVKDVEVQGVQVENVAFQVKCETTQQGMNCVGARISGGGVCTFIEWDESFAVFSCSYSGSGTVQVECYSPTRSDCLCSILDEGGNPIDEGCVPETSATTSVFVVASTCSERGETNCDSDNACEWCPPCDGAEFSGFLDVNGDEAGVCVDKDACEANYACRATYCGATCDGDSTGCAATDCSHLDGCYNEAGEKGTVTSEGWVVYGDNSYDYYSCGGMDNYCNFNTCSCLLSSCPESELSCVLDENTDEDMDGFDTLCDGDCNDILGSVYPGAAEICDGVKNDCEGIPRENEACCETVDSADLHADGVTEMGNAQDIFTRDFVRDYYWGRACYADFCRDENLDLCSFTDYEDECAGIFVNDFQAQVKEYYADGSSYDYDIKNCPRYCNGKTEPDFEVPGSIEYAPGCSEGACISETISDTCSDESVLTEYYCSGNLLKSIWKDCNDYDGYYDVSGSKEYRDYSCVAGICTPSDDIDDQDLNMGQVRVRFKNMGSVPFKGVMKLTVNNFCDGADDFNILVDLDVPMHEYYEEEHDFLAKCTPVKYDFECRNDLNYGVVCKWGLGSGCGILTYEEEDFKSCGTCCGNVVYYPDIDETTCKEQKISCDTSTIALEITDVLGSTYFAEPITNAAWCCK